MSENANSEDKGLTAARTMEETVTALASAIGADVRNLSLTVNTEVKTVQEKLEAHNAMLVVENHRLHKKLNWIIVLGGLGWFALICAQAVVFGNQNQTYKHITSMTEVTSRVAENAVNDTAISNAALTATVCAPAVSIIKNAEEKLK